MNALISVSDKTGVAEFAKSLKDLGFEIYATEGTASYLEQKGIDVRRLAEITDIKETRQIKTLHPAVFERIYSGFFSVVVVNLYELNDIEDIDIGGVALLRASAKNYAKTLVVCNPERYPEIVERLKRNEIDEKFRLELALEAFEYVVEYDTKVIKMLRRKIKNIE